MSAGSGVTVSGWVSVGVAVGTGLGGSVVVGTELAVGDGVRVGAGVSVSVRGTVCVVVNVGGCTRLVASGAVGGVFSVEVAAMTGGSATT